MAFLWFLVGLLLGGCVTVTVLCCIQIDRVNDYEAELRRLRAQLKDAYGEALSAGWKEMTESQDTGIMGGQ